MSSCLFCLDRLDANGLRAIWQITTSTGRVVSVPVEVCVECAHTRRITIAEVFDLARRRAPGTEGHADAAQA